MKTARLLLSLFVLCLLLVPDVYAQLTNDYCTNAIQMVSGVTYTNDTSTATSIADPAFSCGTAVGRGVWYTITPTNNQYVEISTCTSGYDTVLAVYTNTCGDWSSPLVCNDSNGGIFCAGNTAGVRFVGNSNQIYYILVGGNNNAGGNLQIKADLIPPPTNDVCANAIAMNYGQEYSVSNFFYATEVGDPAAGVTRGVWYRVSTTKNQRVNLTTCATTGINYTKLAVYTNGCDPNSVLTSADATGPYCSYLASVSFSSVSNQTYYVLVGASGSTVPNVNAVLRLTADLQDAPTNDVCANAIAMNYGQEYSVSNFFYATEVGDPAAGVTRGVWYRVSTTKNQRVNLTTCATTGINYTKLAVYTNGCDPNSVLTSADATGPYCSYLASVSFSSVSNQTYYVLVGASGSTVPNVNAVLRLTADLQDAPTNDVCANAIAMNYGQEYSVSNFFYATEVGDPAAGVTRGVWYRVSTTKNQRVNLTTCATTGINYTKLAVYTNGCDPNSVLTSADATGPYCSYLASVSFSSVSNQTYYVLVGASGSTVPNVNAVLRLTADLQDAPTNDVCANAIEMNYGQEYSVSNFFYATEVGDPAAGVTRGVWYRVSTTKNQRVNLTTCATTGINYTKLAVYTNGCDPNSVLTSADATGPYCSYLASVSFSSVSNQTYYVLVGASGSTVPNVNAVLRLTADLQDAPTNDVCANAIAMNYGQEYSVSNFFYATEVGDPAAGVTRGVWYRVSTTKNQRVNLTTCATTGINYTKLAVYTNGCDPNSVLTSADATGPYCSYLASVSFSSVSNQTYYVLVGASGSTVPNVNAVLRLTADLQDAPTNDVCANAIEMTNGVVYVVTNMFYATEIGDPITNCGGNIYRGVWYKITPPAGVGTTISTCDSDFLTSLTVYKGTCDSLTNLVCANQSGPVVCASSRASVNFFDTGGQTYYVLASASSSNYNFPTVNTTLRIVATTGAPQNDACNNALDLQAGVVTTVNTLNATETDDPTNCVSGFGRGVWFKYTPAVSGKIGITTCGSTFDTGLSVYTACGLSNSIACNDDGNLNCGGGNASLTFPGVAGTPYLILAGGKNGAGGDLRILVTAVDLVSTSLTATNPVGGQLTAGRNWLVNWGIQNQGTNLISTVWTDSLYLSNVTTHAVVQLLSGQPLGHSVPPGSGYNYDNYSITQPLPQIAAGHYVLVGTVDVNDQVAETLETNNVSSLALVITNLPPTITLVQPTNHIEQTNCVPVTFKLRGTTVTGSYTITNVSFFANGTNFLGRATNAPYATTSLALPHGVHTITAVASDNFGLTNVSVQDVSIAIRWPTNLHELRVDIATNGDFIACMCAYADSNYVVLTTTNLAAAPVWQPYATNVAANGILSFTNSYSNRIVTPRRYFRAVKQ